MSKKNEDESVEAEPEKVDSEISVDSNEREGNDIPSLIGSGAPMITIRANTNIQGLAVGEVGTFIQSEEIRLQVQQGLASVVA